MSKIKRLDKPELSMIRARLEKGLETFGKEVGLQFRVGRMTSTDYKYGKINVTMSLIDESTGKALSKEAEDFKRYASRYGLAPGDLNRCFTTYGKSVYELVGCVPRRPKYPLLGKRVGDGKMFKFHPNSIRFIGN